MKETVDDVLDQIKTHVLGKNREPNADNQYQILPVLALLYHFSMFFCLIAIFNFQHGRELNINKALQELS